jgi:hypothetical protein
MAEARSAAEGDAAVSLRASLSSMWASAIVKAVVIQIGPKRKSRG